MNSRLQNGNYFLNKEYAVYHRPPIQQTVYLQSKSAMEIKSIPQPSSKKQKTIHYYDQSQFEQFTSAKTKLYDLLSLRQTNRTPIQKRGKPDSAIIVKRQTDIFTSVVEVREPSSKMKTLSQECPRTQQKIPIFQHTSQLASTQKRHQNHCKSNTYNNNSTPILNKSVSQFSCLTPNTNKKNPLKNEFMQKIKHQKIESLVNMIQNNQVSNIANGFSLIKNTAPLLPFIKELERRKAEFRQRKFQIKLFRIK